MEQTELNQILGHEAPLYFKRCADSQIPDGLELMNVLHIAEGSKVLDLGCGTGNLTVELAKRVGSKGQVIGVDPDGERIKVAKEHNGSNGISFTEANGETFPEGQYDLVFSTYVIHWIENKDKLFKRIYNNLRPGGVFAFTITLAMPPLMAEEVSAIKKATKSNYSLLEESLYWVTTNKMEELATSNGFTVTRIETGVTHHPLPSIENALEFIYCSTNGRFDTALKHKEALEELREKYREKQVEFSEEYAAVVLTKN